MEAGARGQHKVGAELIKGGEVEGRRWKASQRPATQDQGHGGTRCCRGPGLLPGFNMHCMGKAVH